MNHSTDDYYQPGAWMVLKTDTLDADKAYALFTDWTWVATSVEVLGLVIPCKSLVRITHQCTFYYGATAGLEARVGICVSEDSNRHAVAWETIHNTYGVNLAAGYTVVGVEDFSLVAGTYDFKQGIQRAGGDAWTLKTTWGDAKTMMEVAVYRHP